MIVRYIICNGGLKRTNKEIKPIIRLAYGYKK